MHNNHDIFEQDDVRAPIPVTKTRLIGGSGGSGGFDELSFEQFREQILQDPTIDHDMKQIIIASRQDFITNQEIQAKENGEKTMRLGQIVSFIARIKNKNFLSLSPGQKKYVLESIDNWIDGLIESITLESEILYQLYELIDLMGNEKKITNTTRLKEIFSPTNLDEFNEFVQMMDLVKTKSIEEEEIRIKKAQEQQQQNELAELETKSREKILFELMMNLNKMSGFDPKTEELRNMLEIPIDNFLKLKSNFIEIDSETCEKTTKFIRSVRINPDNKNVIIGLLQTHPEFTV